MWKLSLKDINDKALIYLIKNMQFKNIKVVYTKAHFFRKQTMNKSNLQAILAYPLKEQSNIPRRH